MSSLLIAGGVFGGERKGECDLLGSLCSRSTSVVSDGLLSECNSSNQYVERESLSSKYACVSKGGATGAILF